MYVDEIADKERDMFLAVGTNNLVDVGLESDSSRFFVIYFLKNEKN